MRPFRKVVRSSAEDSVMSRAATLHVGRPVRVDIQGQRNGSMTKHLRDANGLPRPTG